MKDDWLTIPDAPNYEINSQLVCRNKKTKKILSLYVRPHRWAYYSLRRPGQCTLKRSPKSLRAQAVVANQVDTFEPIPSLGGKYEVNITGKVRNANTKRICKPRNHSVIVRHNGKYSSVAVADYLWEVHGKIIKRKLPCPCSAENNYGKHFFTNMKACARFLAPKLHYCVETIALWLTNRKENICGWKITYLDADPHYNDYALANVTTPKEVYK